MCARPIHDTCLVAQAAVSTRLPLSAPTGSRAEVSTSPSGATKSISSVGQRPFRSRTGTYRRLTTRRRNRTFQARDYPAVAGFEDRQEGRQTPRGCWGLLAGGTAEGTTGHDTARATAAVRQPTGSPPIPNAVLRVHEASSRVRCAGLDVNPGPGTHRPILRPRSASSHHDRAGLMAHNGSGSGDDQVPRDECTSRLGIHVRPVVTGTAS